MRVCVNVVITNGRSGLLSTMLSGVMPTEFKREVEIELTKDQIAKLNLGKNEVITYMIIK